MALSQIDEKLVQMILQQYKIFNAEVLKSFIAYYVDNNIVLIIKVLFREDATPDQLIDVILGNRKYMSCLYVYNKIDQGRTEFSFLIS